MQLVRLREEERTKRRTVVDAVEVVRQELGVDEVGPAHIKVGPLPVPGRRPVSVVLVVFSELNCCVSLPTCSQFKARNEARVGLQTFEIRRLDGGEILTDGSVRLTDATRLHAVEVVPTFLQYERSELEERILRHVIALTNANHCYRSLRYGLPPPLQAMLPDIRMIDYSRLPSIQVPGLKIIRAYIRDHDPSFAVSNQTIANTLERFGVRIPSRRRNKQPVED